MAASFLKIVGAKAFSSPYDMVGTDIIFVKAQAGVAADGLSGTRVIYSTLSPSVAKDTDTLASEPP